MCLQKLYKVTIQAQVLSKVDHKQKNRGILAQTSPMAEWPKFFINEKRYQEQWKEGFSDTKSILYLKRKTKHTFLIHRTYTVEEKKMKKISLII